MSIDVESSIAATKRRLTDLREFQLPRLKRCLGPLGLHRELAEEMRVDLESVRRSLEMSRELAESDLEGGRYIEQVEALSRDLQDLRAAYREGLIDSKRNITSKAKSRRHELLKNKSQDGMSEEPSLEAQKASVRTATSEDDALQTKTNEVTDALRRTTTLMQTELERSVLSVQMLDESTKTLNLTQALYDNYTSLLSTSSHLVKAIEKADWYDRLLIFAAFFLFLLVVGWVIKRRVLDKVVGGVGWWVGGSWKLVMMGVGRGGAKKGARVVKGVSLAITSASAAASVSSFASVASVASVKLKERTEDTSVVPEKVDSLPSTSTSLLEDIVPTDDPSSAVPSTPPAVKDEL